MRTNFLLGLACLALATLITGCNSSSNETGNSESAMLPKDIFDAQAQKFADALSEFRTAYSEAAEEDRQKLIDEKLPDADAFAEPLWKLVEEHPEDDAAVESLIWIARSSRGEAGKKACEKLTSDYIDRKELKQIIMLLSYLPPSPQSHGALKKMIEESPHDEVKGMATYAMANFLNSAKGLNRSDDDSQQQQAEKPNDSSLGPTIDVDFIESLDVSESNIKSLYQSAIDSYGKVKPYPTSKRKLADMAKGAMFEMENLAIGKEAPDIEAEDLDGTKFKLSEYRGKVVVIDFWGDW